MHAENAAHHPELEMELYDGLKINQNTARFSTSNIVCKELQLGANFKGTNKEKLRW